MWYISIFWWTFVLTYPIAVILLSTTFVVSDAWVELAAFVLAVAATKVWSADDAV